MKLTVDSTEAAKILHTSEEQVERLARSGKLPAFKVGRSWVIPLSTLEVWMTHQANANLRQDTEKSSKYPAL